MLNESIILRRFGGFETSYEHATYEKEKKKIIPPGKKVKFRPEWIRDNGVLEKHISDSLSITTEAASKLIDDYVDHLYKQLNSEGKVSLSGVGEFILDKQNRLVFSKPESINLLADSFGLDALDVEPQPHKYEIHKESGFPKVKPQKRQLTGWYIVIGLLLLFISVTSIIVISGSGKQSILPGIRYNSDNETEIIIFGSQGRTDKDSITQIIEKTLDEKTVPENALALGVDQGKIRKESGRIYCLIAGSFKSFSNAEILRKQLLNKGFDPTVMTTGKSQFRVVIGKYSDRKIALKELQRIRRQLDQSVWLLETEGGQ